jgi:4,4'-diaponeurosporenoate glycosyltransferase
LTRTPRAALGERVSVVIPARDEETNLPVLLGSLAAQDVQPREVVVVDDASSDRTAEVARGLGARVVTAGALPDGWRGKTWACHRGALAASGDWLLFLDADTWFEPWGLGVVLEEFDATGGGAMSVAPYHAVRRTHEQFSLFFNLVMLAGTGAFTLLGDRPGARGLLGQCLLVERAAYSRVGGHEAVKGQVLENFWLAGVLRGQGVPRRCRAGKGVFSFRMYPRGWREMVDGWTKGFASGAGRTPLVVLLLAAAWLTGLAVPPVALALGGGGWSPLAAYALCAAQVGLLARRTGAFWWVAALLYPLLLAFYFAVFARSAWRGQRRLAVTWKGRLVRAG